MSRTTRTAMLALVATLLPPLLVLKTTLVALPRPALAATLSPTLPPTPYDPLCNDLCHDTSSNFDYPTLARNGRCQDSGKGSENNYSPCDYGSDCADCGRRTGNPATDVYPPTPSPTTYPTFPTTSTLPPSSLFALSTATIAGLAVVPAVMVLCLVALCVVSRYQRFRRTYPTAPASAFFPCTREGQAVREHQRLVKAEERRLASMNWCFISYCKATSASDATHFYDETKRQFPTLRVFFDAETLADVAQIAPQVQNSRNVVVFLTPEYIRRPYCLAELCSAVKFNVPLHPVLTSTTKFDFDATNVGAKSEAWVRDLMSDDAWSVLNEAGFDVADVQHALKKLLSTIAHPLSTNAAQRVRQAELEIVWALMGQKPVVVVAMDKLAAHPGAMDAIGQGRGVVFAPDGRVRVQGEV